MLNMQQFLNSLEQLAKDFGPWFQADGDDTTAATSLNIAAAAVRDSFAEGNGKSYIPRRIIEFFEDKSYAVGDETLQDNIPKLLTLHRGLAVVLILLHVLGNCLSTGFRASGIGGWFNRFIIGPVGAVTGALYGFVTAICEGSSVAVVAHTVAWTVILLGSASILFGIASQAPIVYGLVIVSLFAELLVTYLQPRAGALAQFFTLIGLFALLLALWRLAPGHQKIGFVTIPTSVAPTLWALGFAALIVSIPFRTVSLFGWPIGAWIATGEIVFVAIALGLGEWLPSLERLSAWGVDHAGWLIVSTGILIGILGRIGRPLVSMSAPLGIVSYELAGSGDRANSILHSWGQRGRSAAVWSLVVDFGFIAAYTTTLAVLCRWASEWWKDPFKPVSSAGAFLAAFQILTAVADVGENIALLWGMKRYSTPVAPPVAQQEAIPDLSAPAGIARVCAIVKFSLIGAALIYITSGAALWTYQNIGSLIK